MEQEMIAQTAFDQLVCSEQSQMLKALIPYLTLRGQQILSTYTKAQELQNTMRMFGQTRVQEIETCGAETTDPLEILENIRKFSYGQTRKQLDQISNMMIMMQLLQTMNEE